MQKHVNLVDLVKSFETSIYYLLAKFGVDTDENEPLKVHLIIKPWDLIFTEPPRRGTLHGRRRDEHDGSSRFLDRQGLHAPRRHEHRGQGGAWRGGLPSPQTGWEICPL